MLSSAARALGSLQGLQRRYIFIILAGCVIIYTLSFHDVRDVVATSKATFESYRDDYWSNEEPSIDGAVVTTDEDGRVKFDMQTEGGSEVSIEVEEEVLPADAGVLPPDLAPVDE